MIVLQVFTVNGKLSPATFGPSLANPKVAGGQGITGIEGIRDP